MFGNARRGVSYLREDVTVINIRSSLFFKEIKHFFWPPWHEGRNLYTSCNQTIIHIVCFTQLHCKRAVGIDEIFSASLVLGRVSLQSGRITFVVYHWFGDK